MICLDELGLPCWKEGAVVNKIPVSVFEALAHRCQYSVDFVVVVVSLFVMDRGAGGVEVERTEMADTRNYANITFSNFEVAETALLGEEGKGFKALSGTLDAGNVYLAAEMLGICQESFDRTLQYLKERKQFGVLIGSFQALQHRAADWWSQVELCKSVVLKAATSSTVSTYS